LKSVLLQLLHNASSESNRPLGEQQDAPPHRTKLWKRTKAQGEALYRILNERLQALEAQGVTEGTYRAERKKLTAEADAELEPLWQRVSRVQEQSHRESSKHERYCCEQRDLLRALEDLAGSRAGDARIG
jgi:hypothetical protein